ncbi:MAG: hypothetical protein ABW168_21255, partial [Sedimenticola sp.]
LAEIKGFLFLFFDDINALNSISLDKHIHSAMPTLPTDGDWDSATEQIIEWTGRGEAARVWVDAILWTVVLTAEDRVRMLRRLRESGADSFPRSLYYRVCSTRLDSDFATLHPSYLQTQWRTVMSMMVLLKLTPIPDANACWGVSTAVNVPSTKEIQVLPLQSRSIEIVHLSLAFADCILIGAQVIDQRRLGDV